MANVGKQITFHAISGEFEITAIGYFVSDNDIILNSILTSTAFEEEGYPMPLEVGLKYSATQLSDYFVTTLNAENGLPHIISTDADFDAENTLDNAGVEWSFEQGGVVLQSDGDAIEFGSAQAPSGVPITKTFKLILAGGGSIYDVSYAFDDGTNFSMASLPQRVAAGTEVEFAITYDANGAPATDFVTISASYWDGTMGGFIINLSGTNND